MFQSMAAGRAVVLDRVGIFADGVAVRQVGQITFPIVRQTCRRNRARVERRDLRRDQGDLRRHANDHGAGRRAGRRRAAAVGRADRHEPRRRWRPCLSGANMNFDRLRFVAERAELGEAREAILGVTIPGAAGSLPSVLPDDRPTRRHRVQLPPERSRRSAYLRGDCDGLARGRGAVWSRRCSRRTIGQSTSPTTRWPSCTCVTWSAVAARTSRHEQVCRFEFPERPGALMEFLDTLGGRWNISLFHYRNHGSDFGRVLAGFEVPGGDASRVRGVPDRAGLSLSARARQRGVRDVSRLAEPEIYWTAIPPLLLSSLSTTTPSSRAAEGWPLISPRSSHCPSAAVRLASSSACMLSHSGPSMY